jgi:hypothetical protein
MTTTTPKSQLNQNRVKKVKNPQLSTNNLNDYSTSSIKMMKSNSYLPKLKNTNNYDYNTKINLEEFDLDNLVNKEVFLKAYYKARRKMIVSKHLDDDFRNRLGILKYENYEKRELIYPKKPKLKKEFSWFNDYYYKYQKDHENRSSSTDDEANFISFKIDWTQLSKERFSNANKTTLPPIRFGSTLSKDAQFALMKSLEDQIVREIETSCPELTNKVPRTTTAQYSRKFKLSKSDKSSENSSSSSTSSNGSDYLSTNRSRLSILNNTNNKYESSELFSNDDNFGFANRDLNVNSKTIISTSESNKTDDNEIEMIKKLVITEQINSAMDILDNIRKVTKPKKQFHKKLQFDTKLIDRMKFGPQNASFNFSSINSENSMLKTPTLPPLQQKSVSSALKQKRPPSRSSKIGRSPSTLAKLEPNLVKYNEWKSQWFNQLHNI